MKVGKSKKKKGAFLDFNKKNIKKMIRTTAQIVFLFILFVFFIKFVFSQERYQEPNSSSWSNHDGFIALSYFGVSRSGSETLIAKQQLKQQLQALKERGYVTISQQDIIDFYEKGKMLPEKALYLSFEDGRNDSSIFAQPLLEKLNFRATILTYANKFGPRELKFLQPEELLKMQETGFWEIGSNGYRLAYINIFDKEGHHFTTMDELEFDSIQAETYNHYLMDFLRDENGIPIEDRDQMEVRVNHDYQLMEQVYLKELGFIPRVYMIMHANALYNNMNRLVEDINNQNIRTLFNLHFNREGHAFNDRNADVLNLSRIQAAPHWSVNHLLMKIQEDSSQQLDFVLGDEQQASNWKALTGAAEFAENKIILTSPSNQESILILNDSQHYKNYRLEFQLEGIPDGKQSIYLKYDVPKDAYLKLVFEKNGLSIVQKGNSKEEVLYHTVMKNKKKVKKIKAELVNHQLTLWEEEQPIIENLSFHSSLMNGNFALSSEPASLIEDDQAYDDLYYKGNHIYDAIFSDIQITELTSEKLDGEVLYSNKFTNVQRGIQIIKEGWNKAIDWAIEAF